MVDRDGLRLDLDSDSARQTLRERIQRVSPRRVLTSNETFMTSTPQFYEDITPVAALDRMFTWFKIPPAAVNSNGAGSSDILGRVEFNRLRKCFHEDDIEEDRWKRALEEIPADNKDEGDTVKKEGFQLLFGPFPYFGCDSFVDIMHQVLKYEETLHFSQMLVHRFGIGEHAITSPWSSSSKENTPPTSKAIGLEQLQTIQRASCVEVPIFGDREWEEVIQVLGLDRSDTSLTWMQFAELFFISINEDTVFKPHLDPAAVVHAVLANEKVLAMLKDPDEDSVSRSAFTSLLHSQRQTIEVDDTKWQDMLQSTQPLDERNTGQKRSPRRRSAENDGVAMRSEQPLVVVRNTENKVLSYDVVFTEVGNLGITLQSDFYGQCLTVASKRGPAATLKYGIIQEHDIVASVNGVNLINDSLANSKKEESRRLAYGQSLLSLSKERKVTFYRQESYFRFDSHLTLYLRTIAPVQPDGVLIIKLPKGLVKDQRDNIELKVQFEIPQLQEFESVIAIFDRDTETVRVVFDGEVCIAEDSTLVFSITGISCKGNVRLGPCELSLGQLPVFDDEPESVCFVTMLTNWHQRVSPIREQSQKALQNTKETIGETELSPYNDTSLQLRKVTMTRDPGFRLGIDFFGQCPIITDVKSNSGDIQQHDILCSIISDGEKNSLNQFDCIKPFALSKREADDHLSSVQRRLEEHVQSRKPYVLHLLRLQSYFYHEGVTTTLTFCPQTTFTNGAAITFRMPRKSWTVKDLLTSQVLDPPSVIVKETTWDSQSQSVRLVIQPCDATNSITIQLQGITSTLSRGGEPVAGGGKLAGPSEVVCLAHGSYSHPARIEFELHENWYSFLAGHEGIEPTKVIDMLRSIETTPAKLWEELEYMNGIFEAMRLPNADTLTLSDVNRLLRIIDRSKSELSTTKWDMLCNELGASAATGLTRRQFACSWYQLTGHNTNEVGDIFFRLDSAQKLFDEIKKIFKEDSPTKVISRLTITRLADLKFFPKRTKDAVLEKMESEGSDGWNRDVFAQIMCGNYPEVVPIDSGTTFWLMVCFAKKLFAEYAGPQFMTKLQLAKLLSAARVETPKLTDELWGTICDTILCDQLNGLRLSDFLRAYASGLLGSRDAVNDYYTIELHKLLPFDESQLEGTREAVMAVARERVDVEQAASRALEEASVLTKALDDLQDEMDIFTDPQKKPDESIPFGASFEAVNKSRDRGFLHISITSITELADRSLEKGERFSKKDEPEELYLMIQVVEEIEESEDTKSRSKMNFAKQLSAVAFGDDDDENAAKLNAVAVDERWNKATQDRMRRLYNLEQTVISNDSDTAETQLNIKVIEDELSEDPHSRVFSSKILRDSSPNAFIRFTDDKFRLFVNCPDDSNAQQVVCKLYKRKTDKKSGLELQLKDKKNSLKRATDLSKTLGDLEQEFGKYMRQIIRRTSAIDKQIANQFVIYHHVLQEKSKFDSQKETLRAEIDELSEALKQVENEAQNDLNTETETDTRLIGKASFDLQDLLQVLHDDNKTTDDLKILVTNKGEDVGVLKVEFQYKCKRIQEENDPSDLPPVNDELTKEELRAHEAQNHRTTYKYPFRTHLRMRWHCDKLKPEDRLILVREGTSSSASQSLAAPMFMMFWRLSEKASESDGNACYNWSVPDSLKGFYGKLKDPVATTDIDITSGVALFPSAHRLNLPPGRYVICLVRYDIDPANGANTRAILGRSPTLGVVPGDNSIHTMFGTTPLVDVRPFIVSLKVYPVQNPGSNNDREAQINSTNSVEFQFNLGQAKPQYNDWIVILPEEIMHACDNLRAKMLGMLQANSEDDVLKAMAVLNEGLPKALETFDTSTLLKATKFSIQKFSKTLLWWPSSKNDHEIVDEFWKDYRSASPIVQRYFPLIIRDVVDEISARSVILGLNVAPPKVIFKPKYFRSAINAVLRCAKFGKTHEVSLKKYSLMGIGKAFPVIKKVSDAHGLLENHITVRLGSKFSDGGRYVAKYVRRQPSDAETTDSSRTSFARGELCRYGPFDVEETQRVWKWSYIKAKMIRNFERFYLSNQFAFFLQLLFTLGLGFIKYALALANLSFNLMLLANAFMVDLEQIRKLKEKFEKLFWAPLQKLFKAFNDFAEALSKLLVFNFDLFHIDLAAECVSGFYLIWTFIALVLATLLLYVVVQEDVLLKVQKLDERLPVKGLGALFVIPIFLSIKSCVIFISAHVGNLYRHLHKGQEEVFEQFHLYTHVTHNCTYVGLAKVNYSVGVIMLVVITAFMFVCIPLLLLDLYSWVPLARVEEQKKRQELSYTHSRKGVKEAIRQNASLVEWRWDIQPSTWPGKWKRKLETTPKGRWIVSIAQRLRPFGSALLYVVKGVRLAILFIAEPFVKTVKWVLHGVATAFALLLCGCCSKKIKDRALRVASLITLIPWAIGKCKLPPFDESCDAYLSMSYSELISRYGFVRLVLVFFRLYLVFMTRSIGRALGAFLGWRSSAYYMYFTRDTQSGARVIQTTYHLRQKEMPNQVKSSKRYFNIDKLCLRFNWNWKLQYIKDKVVMPLANLTLVSGGIWGENQWKEFGIEPRANDCYKDEPSGEIKQLQTMALHGKIVSLFWLCIPNTLVVAYLAEVLNRGPILAYFVNKKFLQADFPESERDKDPVWRFLPSSWFFGTNQQGVVYLTNTSFFSTTLRWASAIGELVALFRVQYEADVTDWLKVALYTTAVTPTLEILQQVRNAWVEYVEANDGLRKTHIEIPADKINTMDAIQSTDNDGEDTPDAGVDNSKCNRRNAFTQQRLTKSDKIEAGARVARKLATNEANNIADNAAEKFGVSADLNAAQAAAAKKKLVILRAMPEMNYVVLADALDRGEGEVTVSWKVNARQRYHAMDAIGLFPTRVSGSTERRTMDQCICYRLLKESGACEFGWKPKTADDAEISKEIIASAQKLFRLTRSESQKLDLTGKGKVSTATNRTTRDNAANKVVEDKFNKQMKASKLKPGRKLTDTLQEAVITMNKSETRDKPVEKTASTDRKEDREVVSGEVKFRPANNSLSHDDEEYDSFIYGNDVGIYPPKYGLQSYEFCYLRYNDDMVQNNDGGHSEKKLMGKVRPKVDNDPRSKYEVLDLLSSNEIKIGTFNLFMNLTCDQPLVGPGKELSLTWTINGVNYDTLAKRGCRNCVGFYRVSCVGSKQHTHTSAGYAKIEVVPTSAYIKADPGKPCAGRMVITAPTEPGMYEIRFLFNYFKDARLHRQCQVFGDLEDEMQVLRIRSFYEKHAVTDALNKFSIHEVKQLDEAHDGARKWLVQMILSAMNQLISNVEKTWIAEYNDLLLTVTGDIFEEGLKSQSKADQDLLRSIVQPLAGTAFLDVLQAALDSNRQACDQLNSIVFPVATDEDLKLIKGDWINQYYKRTLLPLDDEVRKAAGAYRSDLSFLALKYLQRESLCGFHDLVDDIVLTHELLLTSVDQIMNDLASSCITLYEKPIREAVDEVVSKAPDAKCEAGLRHIDRMLIDLCRSHLQQVVRAFLETDHNEKHCGLKWELPHCEESAMMKEPKTIKEDTRNPEVEEPKESENSQKMRVEALRKRLDQLKSRDNIPDWNGDNSNVRKEKIIPPERDSFTPVTLQHIAVRKWVVPLLTRKIVVQLRQRYARAASKTLVSSPFTWCSSYAGAKQIDPWRFPSMWANPMDSPLYFLGGDPKKTKSFEASTLDVQDISNQQEVSPEYVVAAVYDSKQKNNSDLKSDNNEGEDSHEDSDRNNNQLHE